MRLSSRKEGVDYLNEPDSVVDFGDLGGLFVLHISHPTKPIEVRHDFLSKVEVKDLLAD